MYTIYKDLSDGEKKSRSGSLCGENPSFEKTNMVLDTFPAVIEDFSEYLGNDKAISHFLCHLLKALLCDDPRIISKRVPAFDKLSAENQVEYIEDISANVAYEVKTALMNQLQDMAESFLRRHIEGFPSVVEPLVEKWAKITLPLYRQIQRSENKSRIKQ